MQVDNLIAYGIEHYPYVAVLQSHGYTHDRYRRYQFLAAFGKKALTSWQAVERHATWRFGAVAYPCIAQVEPLLSYQKKPWIPFPEVAFFIPEIVVWRRYGEAYQSNIPLDVSSVQIPPIQVRCSPLKTTLERSQYIATVQRIQEHIYKGEVYEVNIAQAFYGYASFSSPYAVYKALCECSPMPFSAYLKWRHLHVLCASPERFLQREGRQLRTQPIKGTWDAKEENAKEKLLRSEKDRAENAMIVDLCRNDLQRVCEVGSVHVPALFEVYRFPFLYHLISTIEGRLKEGVSWQAIFKAVFPPGSMTGAPKLKAMELIERYEPMGRGIYAGSIGYIDPQNNADFNVVIRTMVYDAKQQKLSFHVGGAVTLDSDPEGEYQESLLKGEAIQRVLGSLQQRFITLP